MTMPMMFFSVPPNGIHFCRSGVVIRKPTCRNWKFGFCLSSTGKTTGEDNQEQKYPNWI
jgi:hypothetical protein